MILVNVPNSPWSENRMSLGGQFYNIIFRYNSRDERWRMDIYKDEDPVILGVKIMENQSLLGRYILEGFDHGDIFCVRNKNDKKLCGRDNLGIGLAYQLVYLTNAEISEL
jgi:hypothetical protein